jgi:hypothetical protein
MEGTITGRGIEIKWTVNNPKQAFSGTSKCFRWNAMTKHRRKDHPMWKMIGEDRRRAEKVGEGRIMWILAGAGYGRHIITLGTDKGNHREHVDAEEFGGEEGHVVIVSVNYHDWLDARECRAYPCWSPACIAM